MTDTSTAVALVCDADADTGLGHLSRCLALAEALQEQGATCNVVGVVASGFRGVLDQTGVSLIDARVPLGAAGATEARCEVLDALATDLVVIDSYATSPDDLAQLGAARTSAVIDDFAALARYPTDLVLNFTVAAEDLPYPSHPDLLLGPQWFLARRDLRQLRSERSDAAAQGPVQRVLVSIGGADRTGTTRRVVEGLLLATDAALDVVIGRPGPDLGAIEAAVSGRGGSAVTVAAPSLAPFLGRAHLVVCGGGLTKYEAAYLGLPVAVIDQNVGQAGETAAFASRGLAVPLGDAEALDPDALVAQLHALTADATRRAQLGRAGRSAFPDDPTAAAATRLLQATQA